MGDIRLTFRLFAAGLRCEGGFGFPDGAVETEPLALADNSAVPADSSEWSSPGFVDSSELADSSLVWTLL